MSDRLSYQQLDPVGTYGTRPVTIIVCAGTAVYALTSPLIEGGITIPALAALSILLFAACAGGIIFWSHPLRAPFPHAAFTAIMAAAALALILGSLSTWGNQPNVALAPIAVALLILQVSPYRPPRDLLAATLLTTVIAAFLGVIRPGIDDVDKPIVVTLAETVIPLLAIGIASSAFASQYVRRLAGQVVDTEPDSTALLREGITRSVQNDRISILNRSVVPFLTDLLQRGTIDESDHRRAFAIANSIRTLMVADVERSWLDSVIEQLRESHSAGGTWPGSEAVQDDDRLANVMVAKQRTVLRALLAALFAHPGFDADGFGVLIERDGDVCRFTLSAKLDREDSMLRSGLGAYFAALRIIFSDLELAFDPPTLTLRFFYDHL